ncbi:MAG: HlyD family efflux transporter periplasmic adaptor subunit [Bryobacteraceae bacterium]|jgi:HlyD family secretion protein
MKLLITDTNGEQLTIATNGNKDERQANNLTPAADGAKQTEQKPPEPAPAANGDKKTDQKPQESAPAADGAKGAELKPQEPAETASGDKKNEQQPQPSPPDTKLPPDATNKKIEQKSPDSKAAPPKEVPHSRRKILLVAVAFVALAAGAYIIWRVFFAKPKLPDSIVTLSGRIEGDNSAIAAKSTGRILEIRFREGDAVNAGDVIAILSDEQVRAREGQAQAGVSIMEGKSQSALDQIAVLQKQMQQNQLQTAQSKIDAEGRVRQAEAEVAAVEADLAQQQASYQIAAFDRDAYTKLADTGAASERQAKQAIATAGAQAAVVSATSRRVESARGALTTAKANLENPGIREDQVAMTRRQIIGQQSEFASARAGTQQARGQLLEAQANRQDLVVRAPFTGVVVTRAAEPGEVVIAGTALVTMVDLTKVYLRGFVPEGQIGKVKLGQPVHVYLDSSTKQPIDAWVARIDPQATFTPENTYFQDERVTQVFGVKLQLKGAIGFAKPGMPVDGEILTQGDTWPKASIRK